MKKTKLKRVSAAAAAVIMAVPMLSFPAFADTEADKSAAASGGENSGFVLKTALSYGDYYDKYEKKARPKEEIVINGKDYKSADNYADVSVGSYEGKSDVMIWANQEGSVTFEFTVHKTGVYNLEFSYYPIIGANTTTEIEVAIDGEAPYDTASRIELLRRWVNAYPIKTNSRDNQMRPPQVQESEWTTRFAKDTDGLFNDPLIFYLEEGTHTLTLNSTKASFALEYMKFCQESAPKAYKKPSAGELQSNAGTLITVEGEDALYKTASTLSPTYDRNSYLTSPSHPVKMRYNTIGLDSWNKAGQTIAWEVNVPADGWYKLGIKGRQTTMRGFYSNRRLYIDGEVPCDAAEQIKFPYNMEWDVIVPTDDNGEELYFYLKKGKHELSLEVIPGEIGEAMRALDDIVFEVNEYYRKILMITGPNPDKYTDYNVHIKIPELLSEFAQLSTQLKVEKAYIEGLSNQKGSEAAALERLSIALDRCVDKPYKIPDMIGTIKDNVTAISSWMRDYRDQPLEIDYIQLASSDMEFDSTKEKFFTKMKFDFDAFIGSFFEDYNVLSDETADSLNVWVGLARDQTQVVKDLVDSYFVPEYNIPVAINLVQGSVLEATLAGKGPDVALFLGGEFPVNLAVRGVTVELSQFDGYDEVVKNFQKNATVMYQFNGGVYGLPISQTFPMMFYRKDVLNELGIEKAPETWQELIDILPALQRSYLNVGLVLPVAANGTGISAATEPGHTFALLMMQSGQNYYNKTETATMFDNPTATQAFETWTDFYTKYKFEQTYDAFSRFRTGEYPIVIQGYTFYNQLTVAAPEIKGLWDFTLVPGTERADGTINHAANSGGGGAIIFNKVENKENAWTFLKWFTSTEIQVEYGHAIEALLGQLGRFDAANMEALKQLSWSTTELEKILAQMEQLEEVPIIPSSYAVTRNIMNAFREVVNDGDNPRDTLLWYNRDINAEITRKRKNLGID